MITTSGTIPPGIVRTGVISCAIIVVGAFLSVAMYLKAREWDRQQMHEDFLKAAENRYAAVKREADSDLQVLLSLQAFHDHAPVTRDEFRLFVTPLMQHHRSIQALEWIPLVSGPQREAYEMQARREGLRSFHLTERTPQGRMTAAFRRTEYFPVYYMEPYKGNEPALGFDLASNPTRKEALERSRDTGEMVATARITLVQETGNQAGFLVFAPVYKKKGAEGSVEMRRRDLEGFAAGSFRIGDLLESSLSYLKPEGVDIFLYDISAPEKTLLAYHPSRMGKGTGDGPAARGAEPETGFRYANTLKIAGREWLVVCRATPSFVAANETGGPLWVLLGGLVFTLMLAGYLLANMRRTARIELLVDERTRELRLANDNLGHEVAVRQEAEMELEKANREMEVRVWERTRELSDSNDKLHQEIAERETVETSLRESEERFRKIFEEGPLGMATAGLDYRFIRANGMFCNMLGYSEEELNALSFSDITHPEDREISLRYAAQMLSLERPYYKLEKRYLKKNGTVLWVDVTVAMIRDEGGQPLYFIGMIQDISERKSLASQLLQAQKMEAVGQLAGGVAHDFNNLLTAIIGFANLAEMKMSQEGLPTTYLQHIVTAAERAAHLTGGLLAFSRKQIINPQPNDLNGVVKNMEKLLGRLISEEIELKIDLADRDLVIMADASQIDQVLMNLATNARDAMPDGGVLTIETGSVEIDDDYIRMRGYGMAGSYAVLNISDSGAGMDKATADRIFEPFFTTKEVGKGTGLGLAIVYGIVKQHNGFINVYSEPGDGTTFRIYLPLIQHPAAPAAMTMVSHAALRGNETVLVVEDNPEVMALTKAVLEEHGYNVIEAVDGQDALKKFAEHQERIKVVFTDVVMPKMNGKECVAEIGRMRPGVKVLFTSGYTPDVIMQKGVVMEERNFISKPAPPLELLMKLREVLAD